MLQRRYLKSKRTGADQKVLGRGGLQQKFVILVKMSKCVFLGGKRGIGSGMSKGSPGEKRDRKIFFFDIKLTFVWSTNQDRPLGA